MNLEQDASQLKKIQPEHIAQRHLVNTVVLSYLGLFLLIGYKYVHVS